MTTGAQERSKDVAWVTRRLWVWPLRAVMALAIVWGSGCASRMKGGDFPGESADPASEMVSVRPSPMAPMNPSGERSTSADFRAGFGDEARPEAAPAGVPGHGADGSEPVGNVGQAQTAESAPPPAPPESTATPSEPQMSPAPAAFGAAKTIVRQPLLIYNAVLVLAVYQAEPRLAEAEKMALDAGGYLVRRDKASITVRVPAARFREILRSMERLGDVLDQRVEAKDVTEEFFDLETRLRNARAMRDRFQLLLERANTVEDALRVEEQLARVVNEIERIEGRLKLLRELVSYSTVQVQFDERRTEVVSSRVKLPFPWLNELGLGRLLDLGDGK